MNTLVDERIIKVALYARVSTEEQKANFYLNAQIELLKKHAYDNRFEVYDEYIDDGYSGTSYERPQFQRLIEDSKQGKFQIILVYRIDRFFRNNKDLLNTADELQKLGINIRSITEPFDTSYLGKFVLSLFGSIAELERNTFMERSKMGKLRRAKEGYYSGASPTRFGYSYNKETKKIEINGKEAEIVGLIFRLYNESGSSILKITRELRNLGYKTKEGHEMREDVVHDILRDSIYIGKWYANRHDSKTGKLKPKEEWIEVKVPKIILEEDFLKAQGLLQTRRNHSERNAKYDYLLQGLVKCGDCGNTVAGTADKQFQIKNGKRYGPYFKLYYRCTHFVKNKFERLVNCNLRYVQAEKIENAVWKEIEKILQKPELLKNAIKKETEITSKNGVEIKQELEIIEKQIQSSEREEQRILDAYRQSIISIEQLKEQIEGIRKNKDILELKKHEMDELLQNRDCETEINNAINYLKEIKENIKDFSFKTRKYVLHLLNAKISVSLNGIVDIIINLPKLLSESQLRQESLPCIAWARPTYLP